MTNRRRPDPMDDLRSGERSPDTNHDLGRRPERQVDDEIAFHVEARTEQLVSRGVSRQEARAQALREFGPMDEARSDMIRSTHRLQRKRQRSNLIHDVVQDIRYGLRSARSRPAAFLVAMISIALGMAAVSTMWTAVDRLILRPLPYDPDGQLVYLGSVDGGRGGASNPTAPGDFLDLQESLRTVTVAAYRDGGANLGGDTPEWVSLRRATPGFFRMLTVQPALGRVFRTSDAQGGDPQVAVLDYGLWERRFGGDPSIIGSSVRLDGRPLTVVGVLPERFQVGQGETDVWLPLWLEDDGVRSSRSLTVMGRLHDDLAATRSELEVQARRLAERFPSTHSERSFQANTVIDEFWSGPVVAQGLGASLAAALFVLLVACANVANLLLARGADRAEEIALRRALGAGRGRILRQLLVEAFLLAGAGGVVGIALSVLGVRGLAGLTPPDMPRVEELTLDGRNVAVGMAMALASVLLFGVLPALRTLASGERRRLVTGARTGMARGGSRLRSTLVAVEVALAVVLVTTTTLLVRSFDGLSAADAGFQSEGVWSFRMTLPDAAYPDEASIHVGTERARAALQSVPGVEAVGLAVGLPGGGWRSLRYQRPEGGLEEGAQPSVLTRIADPAYFEVLGLKPLRGRNIRGDDDGDSKPVALVNEALAADVWPDEDPVGRMLEVGGRLVEVVGLMPDVREAGAAQEPWRALYVPLAQWPSRPLTALFRTRTPEPPLAEIRRSVGHLEGEMAIRDVQTLNAALTQSEGGIDALSRVLGSMALAALFLALVGVYAATNYTVVSRVSEIGLRMALGADARTVRRRVVRRALVVCGVGLSVGLPLAWGMGQGMSRFIYGSVAGDPTIYLGVAAGLLVAAFGAAWLPALRASSVDPMRALRTD